MLIPLASPFLNFPRLAFVQTDSGGGDVLFDLEHDLSGVLDGTVVYVTLTPKASNEEEESTKDEDDNDEDNSTDENTDALLDSIKLAYKQQQYHRNSLHQSRQQRLQRVDEVNLDTNKQQIQLESRQRLPVSAYKYKQQILDIIHQNQVVAFRSYGEWEEYSNSTG